MQNSSVKSLKVYEDGDSDDQRRGLLTVIGLFGSLLELDLSENISNIAELSFLDPSPFHDERSQLKSLDVSSNRIDEEEMKLFIEKLRKVNGLKHLAVRDNDWEMLNSVQTALNDAIRHSTDIEHVDFDKDDLPLDLNRGGRRIFESSQAFPSNLLPKILERASQIEYYKRCDCWGHPTNEEARADVVYWMIHRIVPQL